MSGNLTIGTRIATVRKHKRLTQSDLSQLTGKSRSSIAQIEKDITKPDHDFIASIVRICNTSFEYIHGLTDIIDYDAFLKEEIEKKGGNLIPERGGNLRGNLTAEDRKETYIKKEPLGVRIEGGKGGQDRGQDWPDFKNEKYIKPDESGIPLIPIDAMAGWGAGAAVPVMDYDVDRYVVPEFIDLKVDFIIRVNGNSMYPKYSSGDLVACRKLGLGSFFQWNKVYVLDTSQGAIIKRIHPSDREGYIKCVSENEAYAPFEVHVEEEIYAISLVVGAIGFE